MSAKSKSVMFTPGATADPPTVPAIVAVFGLVPDRVILLPKAIELTGYSGASLDRLEREGKFPPRRQIGPFRGGWLLLDLTAWMHALLKDRPQSRNPAKRPRRQAQATADQQPA